MLVAVTVLALSAAAEATYIFESHREALLATGHVTNAQLNLEDEQSKRIHLHNIFAGTFAADPMSDILTWPDVDLWEVVGIAVFMVDQGWYTEAQLHQWSHSEHQDRLFTELHNRMDVPMSTLEGETRAQIMLRLDDFAGQDKQITSITSVEWHLDQAFPVGSEPEFLAERVYDNCNGSFPLSSTFAFNKRVSKTTSFSHANSISWNIDVSVCFEAKVPFVGAAETTATFGLGGSKSWTHGETDSAARTFSVNSAATVPPGKKAERKMIMTIDRFQVPYTMTAVTALGSVKFIKGTWNGVTIAESMEEQVELPCSF